MNHLHNALNAIRDAQAVKEIVLCRERMFAENWNSEDFTEHVLDVLEVNGFEMDDVRAYLQQGDDADAGARNARGAAAARLRYQSETGVLL